MPEIPKGATVPADHQKPAAQIEAEKSETTEVAWRGHTFTVPTDPDDYPTPAVIAAEAGQNLRALEILLGSEQFAEFLKVAPFKRDVNDYFKVMGEVLGLGD
jgi:hypothetical protein